jgi:hypothetical protein
VLKVALALSVLAVLIILPVIGLNPIDKIPFLRVSSPANNEGAPVGTGNPGSSTGTANTVTQKTYECTNDNVPIDENKTGIIFPLFGTTGQLWDDMLAYRHLHPSLPWIGVVNPHNGPGDQREDIYSHYISVMQDCHISVLGYVSTFWGAVPLDTVKADIDRYREFYGIDGIFLDEMSNLRDNVQYYKDITAYAKSVGVKYVVGNTGTDAAPEYVGVVDNIVISEGYGAPTLSRLGGWHVGYGKENFSYIAYSQSTVDRQYVATSASFASYLYITDDHFPNPYDEMPSHFDELLALLDPGKRGDLHNVVVKSVDLAGNPINGTLDISLDQKKLVSGRGWVTYVGSGGNDYTVTALNNKDYAFAHWEDGSTSHTRTDKLGSASVIHTAYYRERDKPVEPGVTINAMTEGGSDISMWVVVESDGKMIKSGFTPLRFTGNPGQEYAITVAGWQYYKFNKWMDGQTSNTYTMKYSGEKFLTAFYKYESPDTAYDTLTVNTYGQKGEIVTMWTTVRDSTGVTVAEGYSPLTIPVEEGKTYTVGVADWQDQVFDHWQDGSKNRFAEVTIRAPHEEMTAHYVTK